MEEEQPVEPTTEPSLVDQANAAADRLEKATAAMAKENARAEALRVKQRLGGEAEVHVEKQEESASDYAKRALAGDVDES